MKSKNSIGIFSLYVTGTGCFPCTTEVESSETTGRIGVKFFASDDVMFYATGSKGYKAGGINLDPRLPDYDPETNEMGELGIKSTLADGHLRVNLLVNYSWQWDVAAGRAAGSRGPAWAEGLPLATAEVPRVELVVRWGGRHRLSGFLPLQSAYADLYVIDTLWPDMEGEQFVGALEWYGMQDVTLGG